MENIERNKNQKREGRKRERGQKKKIHLNIEKKDEKNKE